MTRSTNRAGAPPHRTTMGVMTVHTAVDRSPRPSTHLPPNLSANIPPGKCVMTQPQQNELRRRPCVASLQSNRTVCEQHFNNFINLSQSKYSFEYVLFNVRLFTQLKNLTLLFFHCSGYHHVVQNCDTKVTRSQSVLVQIKRHLLLL